MYYCKCGAYVADNVPICPRCKSKIFGPNDLRPSRAKCEECGNDSLVSQEGCVFCEACGWSRCG